MFRKLKSNLFYAGVDRNSFDRIKPKIQKANLTMTTVLSAFATILITGMLISSFKTDGISQNKNVYILGLIMSLAILLMSATVARKYYSLVTWLIFLSYSIYYMYGILIGTVTDPNGKTVTFMVFLVIMPILFIDRPVHVFAVTVCYIIVFIILCFHSKSGAVLSVDIIDAIVFGILGVSSGFVVNHMKVRGYVFEQKLHEISHIDQLTQIRNRNAFEFERDSIPDLCKYSLAFVYFDVNGLHEANNEKGHDYGDKMLKYIASEIKNAFSENYTYRIGGDEFVAFVLDKTDSEIEKAISGIVEKIEKENYHVAVGYENTKLRSLFLDNLINDAEKKMLDNKKQYYKDIATRETRNKSKR